MENIRKQGGSQEEPSKGIRKEDMVEIQKQGFLQYDQVVGSKTCKRHIASSAEDIGRKRKRREHASDTDF